MKTVSQVSKISGVSVRALHHYDAIGLLRPTMVTPAGYRLYDDTALARLQGILLFRELEFPLGEIKQILDSPDFDRTEALRQQLALLELRKKHICGLIALARKLIETGENTMEFTAFDTTELRRYAAEARQRWSGTAAYCEYEQKTGGQPPEAQQSAVDSLLRQFAALGELKELPPDSRQAQAAIAALQDYITAHFYTCTGPMLKELGRLYTDDDRFRAGIDKAGGDGTAAFAGKAIAVFCAE